MKTKVVIPIGLPGAGKTRYGLINNYTIIDMDKYIGHSLKEVLQNLDLPQGEVYLDGLFITETSQKILTKFFTEKNIPIEFVYIDAPRNRCLLIDKSRVILEKRKASSEFIIKNAKVNVPKDCKKVKLWE